MLLLKRVLHDTHLPLWLIALVVVAFILRIPTFFEPLWYGDEAIHMALGEGIRQGLLLYRDIHDNKPPLLYLVAALAGNLFWFKVILTFSILATTVLFFKLGNLLFPKNVNLVKVATLVFTILTTLPLIEGNLANSEIFILLPTLAGYYILFSKKPSVVRVVAAGMTVGIGILFKIPAILDLLPPIAFLFVTLFPKKATRAHFFLYSFLFLASSLSPISLTFLFWATQGALDYYLRAAFSQNINYLSTWRGTQGNFATQNLPLLARGALMLFFIGALFLLSQRKKIPKEFVFAGVWFVSSLFASLLSERPYPHYLIQIVPSLSLFVGLAITNKTVLQFFTYPAFFLLAGSLVLFKFYYYPVFPYYLNFLSWATGNKKTESYFNYFDSRSARNYKIAKFIAESTKSGDHIFVWGNDPEIYVLSHVLPKTRYITAYHIKDFRGEGETLEQLKSNPPHFIVVTTSLDSFPELAQLLSLEYTLVRQVRSASIFVRFRSNHLKTN